MMRLRLSEILSLNMDISYKIKLLIKMIAPRLVLRKYKLAMQKSKNIELSDVQ